MFNLVHRSSNDFPLLFWQQVVCCEGASKKNFVRKPEIHFLFWQWFEKQNLINDLFDWKNNLVWQASLFRHPYCALHQRWYILITIIVYRAYYQRCSYNEGQAAPRQWQWCRNRGAGPHCSLPIFGCSVNPIPTGPERADYSQPILKPFHLAFSVYGY